MSSLRKRLSLDLIAAIEPVLEKYKKEIVFHEVMMSIDDYTIAGGDWAQIFLSPISEKDKPETFKGQTKLTYSYSAYED